MREEGGTPGLAHARNLTSLHRLEPLASSSVRVYIQGQQYLSRAYSVTKQYPTSIVAKLRTRAAWADRMKVIASYQVKDEYGDVRVQQPSGVKMRITYAAQTFESSCNTGHTQQSGRQYVAFCRVTSLPSSWFTSTEAGTATASVSVVLRNSLDDADLAVTEAGSFTLESQPSWWDAALRTATLGSGLTAPPGTDGGSGVFITLPLSPLYATEVFDVYMYAHTNGFSLNTWTVVLNYDSSTLEYRSYTQSTHFNAATTGGTAGALSWLAAGRSSSATPALVTGTAIFLLRIRLRVMPGTAADVYGGSSLNLYPYATDLVNDGNGYIVRNLAGSVYDARDAVQQMGQVTVRTASVVAIFAFPPSGVLANTAMLTGAPVSYALAIGSVTDDDRTTAVASPSSGFACSTSELEGVLRLSSCSVQLTTVQTTSKRQATVTVLYEGVDASAFFDVYTPQQLSVALEDDTLNRFAGMHGGVVAACDSGDSRAYPYQRTRSKAVSDGLDATSLVSFGVLDPAVAGISASRFDVVVGKSVGSTSVHLGGRPTGPSAAVSVSDTLVSVLQLVARVVTQTSWSSSALPPLELGLVVDDVFVEAVLYNVMSAEGDSGRMFSRVVWSDGHEEDVGYSPAAGIEEMAVSSGSAGVSLVAPSGSEHFWQMGVAVGAVKECVSSVFANWTLCGVPVASARVPLNLDLPDPLGARVTIVQTRLTAPDDDASGSPLDVPSSSSV